MLSKFTLNSAVLLGLTAFTVAVAVYFRNPLLIYTAIFLVTANLVLYIWAQYSVRGMTVGREHPRLVIEGKPSPIQVLLTNNRKTSRFGILGFDMHGDLTPGKEYSPAAFLEAPPQKEASATYGLVPARRGVFNIGPFFLYGGDPFGFYKCWRKFDSLSEITVLPDPFKFQFKLPSSTSMLAQDEMETIATPGESTEFLGVREYRDGEPLKRVHWPTSARLGKLISRQYELNVTASISALLLMDPTMVRGGKVDNPLEFSISMIASFGYATCNEKYHFSYLALGKDTQENLAGNGRRFYQELAIRLAQLKIDAPGDIERARKAILNYLPKDSSLVVFVGELTAAKQELLGQLSANYRRLVAITFDVPSFEHKHKAYVPGPATTIMGSYLLLTVHYGDDLAKVLGQALKKTEVLGGAK